MLNAVSLDEVLRRADVWRGRHLASAALPTVPSGFASLDDMLPGGGWPRGSVTELLVDGAGEISLLATALSTAQVAEGWVMLISPPHCLCAAALSALGIDLSRLLVLRPQNPRDALWAAEQALASRALGGLLFWSESLIAAQMRRLQVAASEGMGLTFVCRPMRERDETSAAPLRLCLDSSEQGELAVQILKRRGPPCHRRFFIGRPQALTPLFSASTDELSPLDRPASSVSPARSLRVMAIA